MAAKNDNCVVMTGGSFTPEKPVVTQPIIKRSESRSQSRPSIARAPFDDTLSERNWHSAMCACDGGKSGKLSLCCCWCYHRYIIAMRVGETPFMGLIPCAAFGLRVKIRTLFGLKGSIIKDFLTTLCCEPCTVCQMSRELDHMGL